MNASHFLNKKVLGALVLVLLLGAAGLAWMERTPLLACYYVRNLAKAGDADRAAWVDRVAGLGEPALDDVLECLNDPSPSCCGNARAALEKLTSQWGPGDARTVALALRCGREFQHFSSAGQRNVLELAAGWFTSHADDPAATAGLVPSCSRLLAEAVATKNPEVQAHALELCGVLTRQPQGNEALSSARDLVRTCLASDQADVRVRAVQLTIPTPRPGADPFDPDTAPGMDLLEQVTLLLNDPAAEVRRAALLAVGPARDAVLDNVLLRCLHDPDADIRRLCERTLKSRGLTPFQIRLGRQLTDSSPVERRKVFKLLRHARELDPTGPEMDPRVWLEELSRDPEGSVRLHCLTAMALWNPEIMRPRVAEMANLDPSDTVREKAQWWLENPGIFRLNFPD